MGDEHLKEALMSQITRRLSPQAIKIRADFEITCFAPRGIDAIKDALFAGEDAGTEGGVGEVPVEIRLIAPPVYVMNCSAMNKKAGIAALEAAIVKITEVITSEGGRMVVKKPPTAVSENEEDALKEQMEQLAKENAEVAADSGSESDE